MLLFGIAAHRTPKGNATRNEGAVFDVARKRWKRMAVPPFDPPILWPSAVWLTVVDGDPRTVDAVVALPEPTVYEPGAFLRFACADDAVYAYTSVLTSAWRFDLATGAWQELPPPPQPVSFVGSAAWTGTELLVSIVIRSREPVTTTRDGFVFDPTSRTWRTTPNAEVHEDDATQVWTDGFAYQLGYEPSGKVTLQTYRPE